MNIGINDFAKKIGKEKKEIIEVVKILGIKKSVLNKEDQEKILILLNKGEGVMDKNSEKEIDKLEKKKEELQQFLNQIIEKRDKLKEDQNKFEAYKKSEELKQKEKFLQDEINHKTKLEELKIQTISKLQEEFSNSIENEYTKVKSKLDESTQKEIKLIEWQQALDNSKKVLEKNKELFESQKEKLLNEYKQELEKDKEIFHNQLEEERVEKLKEINETRENLYSDKENEIETIAEELRINEAKLKTQVAELKAKEKYLETQEQLIEKNIFAKVQEEIKNYQGKITSFENANEQLREELSDLREELDSYEKFKDRNLPRELDERQEEISRLKEELDKTTKMKNDLLIHIDNTSQKHKKELINLEEEKNNLLEENIKVESLKNNNMILEDKALSKENHIEFLQGENKDLNDRLKSIYSDGTEIDERIKDIKEKPYKEIQLDSQISITDEIKYLDSIQDNMKLYGVEYPKRLLYAFHTALKSAEYSPLSVLSGVSGTGKSELPKLYSHFGGFNFLAEAVQPTWDSPASMIGYYNTIDRKFDSTNILKFLLQTSQSKKDSPFGLKESMNMILLDEMNLAHIELYFAEFLSKFEQRRGSEGVNIDIQLGTALNYPLPLDRNMLWIGTMNEDETTKSLSDKVLDRAFSINFPRPTELKSRAKLQTLNEIKPFEYLDRNTWDKWIQKESLFTGDRSELIQKYKDISNEINQHLAPTGRAIGHRVWQSMEYYISNHPLVISNVNNEDELLKYVKLAFEEQLVQKIMPKLRGIELYGKEKDSLMSIKDILNQNDFAITEDFELSMENPYSQFIWNSANYLKED